jgi:hypothetical protein
MAHLQDYVQFPLHARQLTRRHFVQLLYVFSRVGANATVTIVTMVSHAGIVTIVLSPMHFFSSPVAWRTPYIRSISPLRILFLLYLSSRVNHCHIGEGTHYITNRQIRKKQQMREGMKLCECRNSEHGHTHAIVHDVRTSKRRTKAG